MKSVSDLLVIGGPHGADIPANVNRIGDDWASIARGPSGREFHDFRHFIFWPTESVFDVGTTKAEYQAACDEFNVECEAAPVGYWAQRRKLFTGSGKTPVGTSSAGTAYDQKALAAMEFRRRFAGICYFEIARLIRFATQGATVILVAPQNLIATPFGQQLIFGWLSPFLTAAHSPDTVVHDALNTHRPADDDGQLADTFGRLEVTYAAITGEIETWPSVVFNLLARLDVGETEQQLFGSHVWGHYFMRWRPEESIVYSPDVNFANNDLVNELKNVPVLVAPGHTNMAGDPKSILFATGQGGIIVLSDVLPLPSLIAGLSDRGRPRATQAPPAGKYSIACTTERVKKRGQQHQSWVLNVDSPDGKSAHTVEIGPKSFLYLLCFYVAARRSEVGLDPCKPRIGTIKLPSSIFTPKTSMTTHKPAEQVNECFAPVRQDGAQNVVVSSSHGRSPTRYTFNADAFELDMSALAESDDTDIKYVMNLTQ